jgi:hypothetical protein
MNKCFGGGNETHRKEERLARQNAEYCANLFYLFCFNDEPPDLPYSVFPETV